MYVKKNVLKSYKHSLAKLTRVLKLRRGKFWGVQNFDNSDRISSLDMSKLVDLITLTTLQSLQALYFESMINESSNQVGSLGADLFFRHGWLSWMSPLPLLISFELFMKYNFSWCWLEPCDRPAVQAATVPTPSRAQSPPTGLRCIRKCSPSHHSNKTRSYYTIRTSTFYIHPGFKPHTLFSVECSLLPFWVALTPLPQKGFAPWSTFQLHHTNSGSRRHH
jgi:hypothetical protein